MAVSIFSQFFLPLMHGFLCREKCDGNSTRGSDNDGTKSRFRELVSQFLSAKIKSKKLE